MQELDEVWSQILAQAIKNANTSGRADVAEYLMLKAANDTVRQASVKWLFDSLIEIAAEANRANSGVSIEREDPHNFAYGSANLVGSLLRVRQGVRCLTLEAGWTRTPADGFMRGGALAFARIIHFGMPKANIDFRLVRTGLSPEWEAAPGENLTTAGLRRHFGIFVGER